jgi:uncharacterized membrane protein YfcA
VSVAAAIAIAVLAGAVGGMLGVGGGILFVPALSLFLGQSHLEAEATSLVAIIPVAAVGTLRQARYGNVRLADGLWVGLLSVAGVALGTVVANSVPERALEVGFAFLILLVALQLVRNALATPPSNPGEDSEPGS